jgi:hypothetical protein
LGAANGLKPSVELIQAMDALGPRSIRQVTRLTRRGKMAPNPSEARLAVALARQTRQRAPTTSAYTAFVLAIAVFLGIFVAQAAREEINATGILTAAAGLWFIYMLILGWIRLRNAATAEHLNLEILQGASEHYSPSWSPANIDIPPAAFVAIALFMFIAYGAPFGVIETLGELREHRRCVLWTVHDHLPVHRRARYHAAAI